MNLDILYSKLLIKTDAKLALVVLDGLGDLATGGPDSSTPLEAASTPNLDALTKNAAQGRMIPVAPGITPGSGPGHLALFGYDPVEYQVGRGVIEALCALLSKKITKLGDAEVIIKAGKGHRFVVLFRGKGLEGPLTDADPHKEGSPIPKALAIDKKSAPAKKAA